MKPNLANLMEKKQLQILMDKFLEATGTATGILDLEGNIITASGWQPVCTKFHRVHPETQKNCVESDTILANALAEGKEFNLYRCLNGLIDVAMPIRVNDIHVANLFIGQFFDKPPDLEFFREQAKKYDFPEEEYLKAIKKVQIIPEDIVFKRLNFLSELSELIGQLSWQKMQALELKDDLEQRIKTRTQALKDAQIATMNIMQDVEEERHKTENLNDVLLKTNSELEMFAYVASHDLQEPLRKIASFTQLLNTRYGENLDEKAQKYMNYIIEGAHRMQQLISDLLQFSRVGTREKTYENTDMNDVFNQVKELLSLSIVEKNAEIICEELPVITADRTLMTQLWQNLLGNALKFCIEQKPKIVVSVSQEKNYWHFSITDNGIGIEKEYAEKIFIIFQRLHEREKFKGTGIGLAICKKIVEYHGGRIWVESSPGKGSTFSFTINKEIEH